MAMIEMRGVSKWFGDFKVLDGCSTRVENNRAILGHQLQQRH